jgi:ELP3 family radical SAM enzyme/protein acetyltransferase
MSDIEDIVKPFWFKNISESNIQKCFNFLDEYYFNNKNINEIKSDFIKFQKENDFNGILKFGSLITVYKIGRIKNHYPKPKPELESILKVQNVRENSGVIVFTIFTSAYPYWTKTNPDGTKEIVYDYDKTKSTNRGEFTCKYDCYFCPKDPDMPKSYIATEPGVARALQNDFDAMKQILDRGFQIIQQGHPIDKIEVLILGGTFTSYSTEYLTEFIRDIYWTFNIFMDWIFYDSDEAKFLVNFIEFKGKRLREKKSLEEEIIINETSPCRVIGLTPETRPDQINSSTIKFFRKIGATRIQLGVQHINDDILRYNNRGCYNKDTIRAIKILKDNGFKTDIHIMCDMPHPDTISQSLMIKLDKQMLDTINTDHNYKVDQIKIYPCVVTPHTIIKKWYDEGIFKPYGETIKVEPNLWKKMSQEEKLQHRLSNPLYKTIFEFYSQIHPSIRVNRIIRDIPTNEICGGTTQTGMRSEIDRDMELLGLTSGDIRYREAGSYKHHSKSNLSEPILKQLEFESSGGIEYFLSFESDEEKPILYSFLRLRLSANSGRTQTGKIIFPELVDCALIRELHTYGKVQPCNGNKKYYQNNNILFENDKDKVQHKGYGKKLLKRAEEIAMSNGYKKIAVISGVGVREYYRKQGYLIDSEEGCFQIKLLNLNNIKKKSILIKFIGILIKFIGISIKFIEISIKFIGISILLITIISYFVFIYKYI